MTNFDTLIEAINKKTMTTVKREREPRGFVFSPEFLEMLEDEYIRMFSKPEINNRNFNSNFEKALRFAIARMKDSVELPSPTLDDEIGDMLGDEEGEMIFHTRGVNENLET